jgi:aldose 1-epimerase
MFEIARSEKDNIETITLKDPGTGSFVEIIPACGAILHSFNIILDDGLLNVIDSYENAADFKEHVTAKGFKGCKLSPFACRLKNATYRFGEKEYTIRKFHLGNNAIHGLLYDANFSVTGQQAGEQEASISLLHQYRGTNTGFPFNYECLVRYQFSTGNALRISTTITNTDDGLLPIQDGWHPYFKFGGKVDDLQLEFQSKELVVFDSHLIPTGELQRYETYGSLKQIGNAVLDNCFTLNFAECQPLCVLRDPARKVQLEIFPGNSYPYLQVYIPPHRNSIALENLSAPPDAFNNSMGLAVLQPGEKIEFTTLFKITTLS